MLRYLPHLLILLVTTGVAAQERGPRRGRSNDVNDLSSLDILLEVPVPGEDEISPQPTPLPDLGDLVGRQVVRITAVDPPSGFDPAEDSGIPLGIPLDRELIRKAVKHMWAGSNYSDIRILARPVPPRGVELLISVEPLLRLKAIDIDGNDAMTDEDVERALGYLPNGTIQPTAESLIELRTQLVVAYQEIGYREAEATLRLETTSEPGKVALKVKIKEGKPERYKKIRLRGLPQEISRKPLLRRIKLRPGTVRNREKIEKALEKLSAELSEAGYLDARIGAVSERRLGRYSVELTVPVEAGIHTTLRFMGNRRLMKSALMEEVEAKGPITSTPRGAEIAAGRIRSIYRAVGLFHARVETGRICYAQKGPPVALMATSPCEPKIENQELVFRISEGPPVEVTDVIVNGNSHMTGDDIEQEIFAFMREKGETDDVFQQINTHTVDDLGISDPRPGSMVRPRGAITPTTETARVYVPERYLEVMEHLVGLYWENGFLEATVRDTCRIEDMKMLRNHGMTFSPLKVAREEDEATEDSHLMSPCVLINEDLDKLLIVLTVEEGPQTNLASIHVDGNDPDNFTEAALIEETGLATDQPYNEFRLREAAASIKATYQNTGHMFVQVSWASSLSEDGHLADVVFEVAEGPKVHVGKILVHTDYTSALLIRDRLTIEKGDLVTPDSLSSSEQRLMELGVFDNVTVQMAQPEWPASTKTIVVRVNESKPQYLVLKGGIATVEGLRVGFEYGYRNIRGVGLNFRFRGRANYRLLFPGQALEDFEERYYDMTMGDRLERHILLGLSTPHIPGTGGILGVGIDGINERTNQPAFSADRWSAFFRVRSHYLRFLPVELKTGVERTTIELPSDVEALSTDPRFQRWARMPEGDSTFWVTGINLAVDLRDEGFNQKPRNVFNPSKGAFLSINADLVRSLTNFDPEPVTDDSGNQVIDPETGEPQYIDQLSNLIRFNASLSGYVPLFRDDVVLALSASIGYVFHLQPESTTWADRYFYMGGVETLRGFPEESLVPEDVYRDWKTQLNTYNDEADQLLNSRGGESAFLLRAEIRFPLAKGFFGGLFGEAGNIWRKRDNLDPLQLRPVAGGGLRYMTPLGPISLDIGLNLNKRPHEGRVAWFFSIGSAF